MIRGARCRGRRVRRLGDAFAELNVGSTTGHVGGDGDGAFLSGGLDDFGFLTVEFGVENLVGNLGFLEEAGEVFGRFDGGGSAEDGLAFFVCFFDFGDDGVLLFATSLEDLVV